MTTGFAELEVGDSVEMKGPLGSFVWAGNGIAKWKGVEKSVRTLAMVCGGSGEIVLPEPNHPIPILLARGHTDSSSFARSFAIRRRGRQAYQSLARLLQQDIQRQ
jgi:hypothetical protein